MLSLIGAPLQMLLALRHLGAIHVAMGALFHCAVRFHCDIATSLFASTRVGALHGIGRFRRDALTHLKSPLVTGLAHARTIRP
ncbi:hypothetical protein A6456_36975 [Paraburkholderia tropica]|nr:hypothetical protein A6456_36975 [Paraburkholderia tropica]